MPIVRNEFNFRRSSEVAATAIDIADYDLVGRFTTDAQVTTCGADESPLFIFAESSDADTPVSVIHRAHGGRMALRPYGSVAQGQKLRANASGQIIASDTAESAVAASKDFAIALEDGHAGEFVECEVLPA